VQSLRRTQRAAAASPGDGHADAKHDVSAWVFYGFTAHPKPNQFERIIQALIFTVILQVFVSLLRELLFWFSARGLSLGNWNDEVELGWLVVLAIGFGALLTVCTEHNLLHGLARRLRLTRRRNSSEVYGFARRT
jgi:hypothetical protein